MKVSVSTVSGLFVASSIALGLFHLIYNQDIPEPSTTPLLEGQTFSKEERYALLANNSRAIEATISNAQDGDHKAHHDLRQLYLHHGSNALVASYRRHAFTALWQEINKDAAGLAAHKRHAEVVLQDLFAACEAGAFDERDCLNLYKPR